MSSATLRNGIDSWVGSNEPGTNRGGDKRLIVRSDGTITNYSYIYFKNPAPRGATVTSATLRLFSLGTFASKAVRARLIIRSWRESFITWNNAPDVSGVGPTVTQASTADGQEWAFDVTALLQALSDGQANYGFRLAATVVDATIARFYSLDSAVNQPVLDVEWSDAPVAPHTLSPSGGRATSLAAPVLRFDYADPAGQSPLTAVQVQVNNNADQFTTPTFDSGTVATTLPELDLSTTTYVGL
ncbi:MAG: DNRLRE domain-containing protein, partial [Gaiellaceae bacterium]